VVLDLVAVRRCGNNPDRDRTAADDGLRRRPERTVEQFESLLTAGGFRMAAVVPTGTSVSLIDAVAV
jgi:hypothetical protein